KNRNPLRVPGTCDWFVSHEHFQTWNESNSSGMLWVSADPGCGKSVLVRHLIDSVVQSSDSRTVCYFFFKDDFPDQKNLISALCCILRQIFIQKPILLSDEILKKFNTGGETFNTSFSDLWQTFIHIAEDENAGEIVCLLDAIDECENQSGQGRSELLKALCTLYGAKRSFNLKFLLTSRPYAEIHRGLRPIQIPGLPVIHLSGEDENEVKKISQEINIYIYARVQDIGNRLQLTQIECNLLLQELMRVPNRTYLWVYLTLDLIEKSISVNKMMITEATSSIPTTVDEAYERILSKSFNTIQAKKVLQIIVAAVRPLTLQEMSFALSLNENHQSYDDLGLLPDDRLRDDLRNVCGLCVVIVDSRVYLLHQTVKEFLINRNIIQSHENGHDNHKWKNSLLPQESHRVLAEICIRHLLAELTMISDSPPWHTWCNIFLDYSAKNWAAHFLESPTETQFMMTETILKICDVDSSCYKAWFNVYWTTTATHFPQGFTTLMVASYFGLSFAVRRLLEVEDIELDALDHTYRRLLLSASMKGHEEVVSLLLKTNRADIEAKDVNGKTPLIIAVSERHPAIVKLLLKAGANLNTQTADGETALIQACWWGHKVIVNMLLEAGANHNIQTADGETALIRAISRGHEAIEMILLKAGAKSRDQMVRQSG
ncbi:NACHT and ankyrin domain protein, partial [Trichoderma virens Gv29-8]